MKAPKITLHADRYYRRHRKGPRGQDLWYFETEDKREVLIVQGCMQEAARAAKKYATENGLTELWWKP